MSRFPAAPVLIQVLSRRPGQQGPQNALEKKMDMLPNREEAELTLCHHRSLPADPSFPRRPGRTVRRRTPEPPTAREPGLINVSHQCGPGGGRFEDTNKVEQITLFPRFRSAHRETGQTCTMNHS
ncbi:hypothetical protein COCON_G00019220 [Conger conger]|uniref:Uncharacterized protein n=1 Tax=Conger conger TaxID=82655 RepID=A0A9Q1E428_CONCO|nr:hypothetical protein COCON_G00019220 [Conger conger]